MLRIRIIPIILIDGFSVLKTINFNIRRNLGSPVTVARTYNTRNVDELILLDIDASKNNRSIDRFTIMDIASELFMPLAVGGGIKSVEDIHVALKMGADKVVINTAALSTPQLISDGAKIFGRQCIVTSIDYTYSHNSYSVYSHSLKKNLDIHPIQWALRCQELGAGEIIFNSVDKDGQMNGTDINFLQQLQGKLKIPYIAQGGVGTPQDCVNIIQAGASAVGAASIFHFTGHTPNDCKIEMKKNNIPVRLN
jgi:imidazole glycerol-phosphate synthase subunit HisF